MSPPAVPARLEAAFGPGRAWVSKSDGSATAWETPAFHLLWSPQATTETSLRRLWEARKGRQAYAVVALAPSDDRHKVLVAGPQGARPIRQLLQDRVFDLLAKCRDLVPREAAATLTREFSRLEESVIPGLRVKDLLTPHFLRERLPQASNARHLPDVVKSVSRPQNLSWRSVFQALGYQVQPLQPRGYLLRADNAPVAVVHALNDPSLFSRLTKNGELPEGMVLADCEKQGAHWGILAAGTRYRLFQRKPPIGPATGQYLEIDLAELESRHRWYLGLLAPQSLEESGWLTAWIREARDFGQKLREGLQERLIRDALPNIARGLGEYFESEGADLNDRKQLRQIEEAALTLVFRFMFLLHTEARGYLPVGSVAYRPHSASQLADDSRPGRGPFRRRSTRRWDRLCTLVRMVRTGDKSAGVPAYNGSLFAPAGFPGSDLLERAEISDVYMAPVLSAIAFENDRSEASGLDYAGLQIGHLGAIYEALLTLRLTRAPEDLAYDARRDNYRPLRAGEQPEVTRADLYYQAQAGGRKAGGVFYTRHEFVDHLLNHSLRPALDDHLEQVGKLAHRDPGAATRRLFDFSVVDPAMGSAHFLTAALDMLADRIEIFLAEVGGLPGIESQFKELRQDTGPVAHRAEDGDLLRRLILKRCIYGVDVSPMAVEVANVTLWLASFVPGLALSYLGSNLKCGNALIGVADPNVVGASDSPLLTGQPVREAMKSASELQHALAAIPDRTPDEVKLSEELGVELQTATAGLRAAFDLWAAEPLGVHSARHTLETFANAIVSRDKDKASGVTNDINEARIVAARHRFFHWPLEFPGVFHRDVPGFDVVIGNPPWNEVNVEELGFYALRDPGLRGLPNLSARRQRIAEIDQQHPEYRKEFDAQTERNRALQKFFTLDGGYHLQGAGNKDLYKLFCERYTHLVRQGGQLGVVLPRTAFLAKGAIGFRRWLFSHNTVFEIDIIRNTKRWAFNITPQYRIALLTAQRRLSDRNSAIRLTGPSQSLKEFHTVRNKGVQVLASSLGKAWVLPVLRSQMHADVLERIRGGMAFGALRSFSQSSCTFVQENLHPYQEFNETTHSWLFSYSEGEPVWKGGSFSQFDPHGQEVAGYCLWEEMLEFLQTRRTNSPVFKRMFPKDVLLDPATHPIHGSRIAFRDVARSTDSRTAIACLIPPRIPLTNSAPYIIAKDWTALHQASILGTMNSLPFDWLARRYVELHLNFYILNMLCFPPQSNTPWDRIGYLAARLSCVNARFTDFAAEAGVNCGPLTDAQRHKLRAEIDALVARAYGLTEDELRFIFTDFTENAVPPAYRQQVLEKFERL